MHKHSRRLLRSIGLVCALALGVTACGDSDGETSGKSVSESDIKAALEKGGEITVWAWEPTLEEVVADFEKEHPKVKVNLVNAGTNADEYTALSNAISAKKGVPDVAQIEYYAIGQYALSKGLTDLSEFGAGKLAAHYSPGPWSAVQSGTDSVYALPMDSGPMALFYNKTVFDKYDIAVP
ncbi:extracellular solute-binding protein, partial [Streptomyces sp. TRM76130]|nr:extracellular solute-binding protein [Streptomyces sp. TRM76130]